MYVFETLLYQLSYVKEELTIYIHIGIDDQNAAHVFACKDIHVTYLNLNLLNNIKMFICSNNVLEQ